MSVAAPFAQFAGRTRAPAGIWAGAVAAVGYTAIVVVGGLVTPGYDHIADPVSSLFQVGAPHAAPIAISFAVYNLAVVIFGLALLRLVAASGQPRAWAGRAGAWAIVLSSVAGVIVDVFQQDPIGTPLTTSGTLHIVFAGVASGLTMVALGMFTAWFLARPSLRGLGWYSLVTLAFVFVFGGVTAAATAGAWPIMGLLERVPIFGFVQWVLVLSVATTRRYRRAMLYG